MLRLRLRAAPELVSLAHAEDSFDPVYVAWLLAPHERFVQLCREEHTYLESVKPLRLEPGHGALLREQSGLGSYALAEPALGNLYLLSMVRRQLLASHGGF